MFINYTCNNYKKIAIYKLIQLSYLKEFHLILLNVAYQSTFVILSLMIL